MTQLTRIESLAWAIMGLQLCSVSIALQQLTLATLGFIALVAAVVIIALNIAEDIQNKYGPKISK